MRFIFFIFLLNLSIEASSTRIMPLGDSITYDDAYRDHPTPRPASMRSAYRNSLWYLLSDAHYNVNFVGSISAGSAIIPNFDPHNEGYPGWKSQQIANIVYSKLIANPPNIILLHIGSNDWSESITGVNNILNEIDRYERNYHHPIKVILAKIINRQTHQQWSSNFNRNLQSLANSRIRNGDDIVIVDMEYGAKINYRTEFQDPTHPNDVGYAKMANVWFAALKKILTPLPTTPSTFTTSSIESDSVVLSWTDSSNNETGFKIYQNNVLIATLPANSTQYTVNNLKRVTSYTYKIIAYNAEGNAPSKSITIKTKDDYAWLVAVTYIIHN